MENTHTAAPVSAEQPSIDTPEFRALFRGLIGFDGEVWPQIIAHINNRLAVQSQAAPVRPTDDDLWDATLRDCDTYHEWADKLAEAIAVHFGVDIGEHSNANLPWSEALDAIEHAVDSPYPRLAAVREWVATAPHGENCYLTDDPEFDRCLCGKENVLDIIDGVTSFAARAVTQQAAKVEKAEQAKPVARLHEETSDRPFTEGKKYFEITILDRARCFDGMELFAPTTSTVSAPDEIRNAALGEAAALCESDADRFIGNTDKGSAVKSTGYRLAEEIRALCTTNKGGAA